MPASIGIVRAADLQRFANTSLVPAVNTVPGVRMEERSPGSYRLSVRGSLVRSPFGIRNVKTYLNGIPFTDAGGNTYLNLLDFNAVGGLEIIKGPGGSLYGAGTGGTLLLESPRAAPGTTVSAQTLAGSYGLFGTSGVVQAGTEKLNATALYARQESAGYRRQTQMRRDFASLAATFFNSDSRTLAVNAFYTDLAYQTPGGLTQAQLAADPRQARPAAGPNRGAEEQQAAVYNRTFNLGVWQEYDFNARWTNKTSLYGTLTDFTGVAIRNYERRGERGFGGRTATTHRFERNTWSGKLTFGGELQRGAAAIQTYGNRRGTPDTLQFNDEVATLQYLLFAQAELDLPRAFYLTVGASHNRLRYGLARYHPQRTGEQVRRFAPVVLPRVALLRKFGERLSVFGSLGYGYSPPTTDEIRPSTAAFNTALAPERGVNYEVGARGSLFQDVLSFDATAFAFGLRETIVSRRAADGAEFFTNAGRTAQRGVESRVSVQPRLLRAAFTETKLWLAYTYSHFTFRDYVQGAADLSGKWLTGVAPHVAVAGLDLATRPGLYLNATYTYTDRIPLDDANTAFAPGYRLLSARLGFRRDIRRFGLNLFGGVDNALDETYSLGNDLNAVGGRFFNPASGRNYYGGVSVKYRM